MFRSTPVIEHTESNTPRAVAQVDPADLIPLSVLQLDLPAPGGGWNAYLSNRHIEIVTDDLGRASILRVDARMLFDEKRANEVRQAERRAEAEKGAIESDRQWRASLPHGLPWYDVPDGVLPVVAMTQAARDAQPKRLSPLQEALSGESLTYHRLPSTDEE